MAQKIAEDLEIQNSINAQILVKKREAVAKLREHAQVANSTQDENDKLDQEIAELSAIVAVTSSRPSSQSSSATPSRRESVSVAPRNLNESLSSQAPIAVIAPINSGQRSPPINGSQQLSGWTNSLIDALNEIDQAPVSRPRESTRDQLDDEQIIDVVSDSEDEDAPETIDDEDCPICTHVLGAVSGLRILVCDHKLHTVCGDMLVAADVAAGRTSSCPVCRGPYDLRR